MSQFGTLLTVKMNRLLGSGESIFAKARNNGSLVLDGSMISDVSMVGAMLEGSTELLVGNGNDQVLIEAFWQTTTSTPAPAAGASGSSDDEEAADPWYYFGYS